MTDVSDEEVIERLEELKETFSEESNAYADVSMTIAYIEDPEYFNRGQDDE